MFDAFPAQSAAFVCICCGIRWHVLLHLLTFVVAYVYIRSKMFTYVCACTETDSKCWKNCEYIHTSSTAQCGGGSFKDTKSRGKAAGKQNGKANPPMDRQVVGAASYLYVYLSAPLIH